jgi:two-component system KDP operon response regulator KdpE
MNNAEIVVIDDEVPIRKLLEITLQSNDYSVRFAATAKDGILMVANHPPDLVILDLGLPDEDGHMVLQKLREWYTKPIIILSVQSSEIDIVKALDNGANDYLVKPFRTGELLARIRSLLRNKFESEEKNPVISRTDLHIDLSTRIVKRNNEVLKLTPTEYSLLILFVRNEGKVLTHHFILKEIWGPGYMNESQYLRVFIAQLRKKLEIDPNRPEMIQTESGVGYRFAFRE